MTTSWPLYSLFLSTPSARRATSLLYVASRPSAISIHALREEGDRTRKIFRFDTRNFYPRPPRGGRQQNGVDVYELEVFLSTPSARRATHLGGRTIPRKGFLSTPSARRATRHQEGGNGDSKDFYPRPPRGGRPGKIERSAAVADFYPRPPRGGRPPTWANAIITTGISIHALREEGDTRIERNNGENQQFLSTPSARRATDGALVCSLPKGFLSTPSARRATWAPEFLR